MFCSPDTIQNPQILNYNIEKMFKSLKMKNADRSKKELFVKMRIYMNIFQINTMRVVAADTRLPLCSRL